MSKVPTDRSTLHTAIARSIHGGAFFDRKYFVRHSRNGSTLKAIYFSSMIVVDGLEACEFGRTSASVFVAERTSKVSHVPVTKVLRRKLQRVRMMWRVTVKVAPREPGRMSQRPNKTVGMGRSVEYVRFLPREHLLRERVPHSSGPTRGNKNFLSSC